MTIPSIVLMLPFVLIPVIGSIARGTQRLNCPMRGSTQRLNCSMRGSMGGSFAIIIMRVRARMMGHGLTAARDSMTRFTARFTRIFFFRLESSKDEMHFFLPAGNFHAQNKNGKLIYKLPVWHATAGMPLLSVPMARAPCRHVFTMELASRLSPTPDGTAKTMGRYVGQCVGWQHDLARARH